MRQWSGCKGHDSRWYQEDVGAELEDAVDTGQLLEHDGVTDPAEELSDELPDHQNHWRVQSHDAAGRREEWGRFVSLLFDFDFTTYCHYSNDYRMEE